MLCSETGVLEFTDNYCSMNLIMEMIHLICALGQ